MLKVKSSALPVALTSAVDQVPQPHLNACVHLFLSAMAPDLFLYNNLKNLI